MKIAADTNVLVRAAVQDDARQTRLAMDAMSSAEVVVLTLPALCEFVWVLSQSYRVDAPTLTRSIRNLLSSENVEADRPAVEAGLAMLEAGGDFADGVIAYEGRRLGADAFVSFDRKAVRLLEAQGQPARFLS